MANNYVVLQILEVWKQTSCFRNFEDLEKFAPTVMLNSFKIEKKKRKDNGEISKFGKRDGKYNIHVRDALKWPDKCLYLVNDPYSVI